MNFTDGNILSVTWWRDYFFWRADPSVIPSAFLLVCFFITDRNGDGIRITDAHNSDGINPSEILSVIILPTVFVPYTDGINPSVKLYNGVVNFQ